MGFCLTLFVFWCIASERGRRRDLRFEIFGRRGRRESWRSWAKNDVVYRNTAEMQSVREDGVPNGASLSWWSPFSQVLFQMLSLQKHSPSQFLLLSSFPFINYMKCLINSWIRDTNLIRKLSFWIQDSIFTSRAWLAKFPMSNSWIQLLVLWNC